MIGVVIAKKRLSADGSIFRIGISERLGCEKDVSRSASYGLVGNGLHTCYTTDESRHRASENPERRYKISSVDQR